MKYPNKDYIEHLRRRYLPGTRLQLSCMDDFLPAEAAEMKPTIQRIRRST